MKNPLLIAGVCLMFFSACTVQQNPEENPAQVLPELTLQPTVPPPPTPTPLPAMRVTSADEAFFLGYYEEAKTGYQQALAEAGDANTQATALLGLIKTDNELGNCDAVIQSHQQITNQFPGSQPAQLSNFFAGKCFESRQDYASAAVSYANLQTARPGIIDDYLFELIGDARINAGDYSNAIPAYYASLSANPPGDENTLMVNIGKSYQALSNDTEAIRVFSDLLASTQSDYTKATANLLIGQSYLNLGLPEQAYARFQDSVNNYQRSYDSYTGLIQLVNDGIPVDELNRGIVDYYAGQYGYALDAFNRYLSDTPGHEGAGHYYKALSLQAMENHEEAIAELDALIQDHKGDRFWNLAWDEKSTIQWVYQDDFSGGAQTLIDFVAEVPDAAEAPQFLFDAARIQERGGLLSQAANTWARLIDEYPGAELSLRALFLSSISHYRLGNFDQALLGFQRTAVLAGDAENQSEAYYWIGKTQETKGDLASALSSWETAARLDPTGYYGIRGEQKIINEESYNQPANFDLGFDLEAERDQAKEWLISTFNLDPALDLDSLESIANDPNYQRGVFFWHLGEFNLADAEFETLRQTYTTDPVVNFRLIPEFLKYRMHRDAIFSARQVLNLANLNDDTSLTAPIYFNHIRFGPYFRELVTLAGQNANINPLLLFSLIRQESMFQSRAGSSAGAMGLMQLMPATGKEMAENLNWPPDFTNSDLWRPDVNITLGTRYLMNQRDYLGGNIAASLAAYNAGPGNAQKWLELSNGDMDLFLEIIRFEETRNYLMQIGEFLNFYNMIYQRSQS